MNNFWDIEFDIEDLFLDEDFVDGLVRLGFTQKTKYFFVKEIVDLYGNLIQDGLCIDLKNKKIHYFPEPNCSVNYDIEDPNIENIDLFIRNHII
jgi:hypothetical protein